MNLPFINNLILCFFPMIYFEILRPELLLYGARVDIRTRLESVVGARLRP